MILRLSDIKMGGPVRGAIDLTVYEHIVKPNVGEYYRLKDEYRSNPMYHEYADRIELRSKTYDDIFIVWERENDRASTAYMGIFACTLNDVIDSYRVTYYDEVGRMHKDNGYSCISYVTRDNGSVRVTKVIHKHGRILDLDAFKGLKPGSVEWKFQFELM